MQGIADESWMQASQGKPQGVAIRFHVEAVQDGEKTDEAGRPIFKDVEFIEKRVPGDRLNVVDRPITDADKKEFALQYRAFKEGLGDPKSGTPLKEWPPLSKSQIETLNYAGIRTVEDLAGLTEDNAKRIGAGVLSLVKKANDYLANASTGAPLSQLRSELEQERLEKQTLQRQVQELGEAVEKLQKQSGKAGK